MTEQGGERRDEALGTALRELEVPEHRERFHRTLRLALERDAAGSQGRSVRPPRGRRWGLAAAAAIIAVIVLVVTMGLPAGDRVATAAEVRATVARAWASAQGVHGTLVVENPAVYGRRERRWEFVLTARGDLRLVDLTRGGEVAYDAQRNVERSLSVSESIQESDVLFASERRGLAPGLPDQGPSSAILDRNLGSAVRALATGEGGSVREIVYQGRESWLLDADVRPNLLAPEASPDHLRVTVDRESGFPLRIVATNDGRRIYETRIEDLRVDPSLPEDAFRFDFPAGAEVIRTDAGFRRVSLQEVEDRVGYRALVPAWVPDGYQLAEVAASRRRSFTGVEAGNPPVGRVVSLSYRRGLDHFLVTLRPIGGDPSAWSDPLATGEGRPDDPERVGFSSGALAGRTGEVLVDPLTVPHVWAMTDRLVVTVSGDLDREELLRVAGSLEVRS